MIKVLVFDYILDGLTSAWLMSQATSARELYAAKRVS